MQWTEIRLEVLKQYYNTGLCKISWKEECNEQKFDLEVLKQYYNTGLCKISWKEECNEQKFDLKF